MNNYSINDFYNQNFKFQFDANEYNDVDLIYKYLRKYHIITDFTLQGPIKDDYENFDDDIKCKKITNLTSLYYALKKHHPSMIICVVASGYGKNGDHKGVYDSKYFKQKFHENDFNVAAKIVDKIATYINKRN